MEKIAELAETILNYKKMQALDEVSGEQARESEQKIVQENEKRFSSLQGRIKNFCLNGQLRSIITNVCLLYPSYLSVSNADLAYCGQVSAGAPFTWETCFSLEEKAEKMIVSACKALISRLGNTVENSKQLAYYWATLKQIAHSANALKEQASSAEIARQRESFRENSIRKEQLTEGIQRIKEEFSSLIQEREQMIKDANAIEISPDSRMKDSVCIGFKKDAEVYGISEDLLREFNTDREKIGYSPIILRAKDEESSVFIEAAESVEKTVRLGDFLFALFYRNAFHFGGGLFKIACIENLDSSQVPLVSLHKSLSGDIRSSLFAPVAGNEQEVEDLLDRLKIERNKRAGIFQSTDIGEYNEKNPQSAYEYICLIVNGYPACFDTDERRKDLEVLIREGAKVGIFTILIGENTEINHDYYHIAALDLQSLGARYCQFFENGKGLYENSEMQFLSMPRGVSEEELKEKIVDRIKNSGSVTLQTVFDNAPSHQYFANGMQIPVGVESGKVFTFDTDTKSNPFAIVIGKTGSGKSAFLHSLILSGAMNYPPDELQYYIVDFKSKTQSAEFSPYLYQRDKENLYVPHVRYLSLTSKPENVYDVIDMINHLVDERANKYSEIGANSFISYNNSPQVIRGELPKMPQIYFLIDEYGTMLNGGVGGDGVDKYDILNKVIDLLKRIRTSGVGIIFSGQNMDLREGLSQVSNRIAFNTGNEDLINRLFTFNNESFRTDNSSIVYAKISDKVGFAVCSKTIDCKEKFFVKMGYAGDSNSQEQLGYAKRIREKYYEKYKDYYGVQIVAGAESAIEADSYPGCGKIGEVALNEELAKNALPLYIGVSGATSNPIPMWFTSDDVYTNYLALASTNKLLRIEMNAMLAYLYESGKRGIKGEIVYCALPNSGSDVGIDGLIDTQPIKALMARHEWLKEHIRVCETIPSVLHTIANAGKLYEERKTAMFSANTVDRSPKLFVFHKIAWLNADIYSKPVKEKPVVPVTQQEENSLGTQLGSLLQERGGDLSEMSDALSFLNSQPFKMPEKEEEEEESYSEFQIKRAFREIILNGNKQNIFLLATAGTEEVLRSAISADETIMKKMFLTSTVYGNFDVMKSKDAGKDDGGDCCFTCPSNIRTRFYDYSQENASAWWTIIEELYKNI